MKNTTKPESTKALSELLASSYTLYLKTHNYHWNVTGPMFSSLHAMFELQYSELALAVDEIAERIRALDAFAPGSYTAFAELSVVKEETGHPSAQEMIKNLADDQMRVADAARAVIAAGEKEDDQVSIDLGVRRIDVHEKSAWMLRSHLE